MDRRGKRRPLDLSAYLHGAKRVVVPVQFEMQN